MKNNLDKKIFGLLSYFAFIVVPIGRIIDIMLIEHKKGQIAASDDPICIEILVIRKRMQMLVAS